MAGEAVWISLGGLLALALAGAALDAARRLAARLHPDADGPTRLAATLAVGFALAVVVFHALAVAGGFTPWGGLAAWGLVAWGARRGLPAPAWPPLAAEAAALRAEWDAARTGPGRGLVLAFGLCVAWALVRALAAPPLGWDSLLYHMVLPAGWVQAGGYFDLAAPDGWGKHRFFAANSEILRAWAMLPFHSDLLANLAGFPGLALALAATRALAGRLGADPERARLAALAVAGMPAAFSLVSTAYVDLDLLATLLAGSLFLLDFAAARRPGPLVLAALAFGTACGIKLLALPIAAVAGLAALACLPATPRPGRALAAAALALAATGAPWYLRTWALAGTPLHPWPVRVAGLTLGTASPYMDWLLRELDARAAARRAEDPWVDLRILAGYAGLDPLDLGPAPLAALLLAPLALVAPDRRRPALLLAALGLAAVAGLAGRELGAVRLHFTPIWARFAAFPAALLLVLAAPRAPPRLAVLLLAPTLAPAIPPGWAGALGEDALARVLLVALALVPLLAQGPPVEDPVPPPRPLPLAGLLVAALLLLPGLDAWRARHRHALYRRVHEPLEYPTHAAAAWEACDRPARPLRIAVATGFELMGLNRFWYPLMGTRLQNTLVYVPPTRDGRVRDGFDPAARRAAADPEAWLARLEAARVDLLVCLWPMDLEDAWARARPGRFVRLAGDGPGARVYALRVSGPGPRSR